MSTPFIAGNGVLYVQVNGPNTKPEYLGCHDLGDIEEPEGEKTLQWCRDPSAPKKYRVTGSYKGAPGVITTSIVTTVQKTADWLEALSCPATLFANMVECGRMDVFENWIRSFILEGAEVSTRRLAKLVSRDPADEDESTQTFDIQAEALYRTLTLEVNRQAINETESLNDVIFCNDPKCADDCGIAQDYCQLGYAVGDAQAASPDDVADVLITEDGGEDGWPGTPADPFDAAMDIASVVCVEIGNGVSRVIVARGTTDAGHMDIAYSDDGGDTWIGVEVGDVDGQYATMGGTLFALDMYHIWLACTDGYIYFSDDGGITWVAQLSGTLGGGVDLNHIDFADDMFGVAVGETNVILFTDDGGDTWELIAGPVAQAGLDIVTVDVRDRYRWWIGYTTDGDLWYTEDSGATWHERDYPDSAGKVALKDVTFINDLVGFFVANTGTVGTLYQTINGGFSWRALTTPTNGGLNAIWACNVNLAYIVGEDSGGTGVILKAAAECNSPGSVLRYAACGCYSGCRGYSMG